MTALRKLVPEGEQVPRLHRVAYYDWGSRRAICYPLGLHWAVSFVRWLWHLTYRFCHFQQTGLDELIAQAEERGRDSVTTEVFLSRYISHRNPVERSSPSGEGG